MNFEDQEDQTTRPRPNIFASLRYQLRRNFLELYSRHSTIYELLSQVAIETNFEAVAIPDSPFCDSICLSFDLGASDKNTTLSFDTADVWRVTMWPELGMDLAFAELAAYRSYPCLDELQPALSRLYETHFQIDSNVLKEYPTKYYALRRILNLQAGNGEQVIDRIKSDLVHMLLFNHVTLLCEAIQDSIQARTEVEGTVGDTITTSNSNLNTLVAFVKDEADKAFDACCAGILLERSALNNRYPENEQSSNEQAVTDAYRAVRMCEEMALRRQSGQ